METLIDTSKYNTIRDARILFETDGLSSNNPSATFVITSVRGIFYKINYNQNSGVYECTSISKSDAAMDISKNDTSFFLDLSKVSEFRINRYQFACEALYLISNTFDTTDNEELKDLRGPVKSAGLEDPSPETHEDNNRGVVLSLDAFRASRV